MSATDTVTSGGRRPVTTYGAQPTERQIVTFGGDTSGPAYTVQLAPPAPSSYWKDAWKPVRATEGGASRIDAVFQLAESSTALGRAMSASNAIGTARSGLSALRLVTYWFPFVATGKIFSSKDADGNPRSGMARASDYSQAVGRFCGATAWLHRIGVCNLGPHARWVGAAATAGYTGMFAFDALDSVQKVPTAPTLPVPQKQKTIARILLVVGILGVIGFTLASYLMGNRLFCLGLVPSAVVLITGLCLSHGKTKKMANLSESALNVVATPGEVGLFVAPSPPIALFAAIASAVAALFSLINTLFIQEPPDPRAQRLILTSSDGTRYTCQPIRV